MIVTYKKLLQFRQLAIDYLRKNEGKMSKWVYALTQGLKRTDEAFEAYKERMQDLTLVFASRDEKGFLLTDAVTGYKFTLGQQVKLNEAKRLLEAELVEVEPYKYAGDEKLPDGVNIMNRDFFVPFVLEELTEEDFSDAGND